MNRNDYLCRDLLKLPRRRLMSPASFLLPLQRSTATALPQTLCVKSTPIVLQYAHKHARSHLLLSSHQPRPLVSHRDTGSITLHLSSLLITTCTGLVRSKQTLFCWNFKSAFFFFLSSEQLSLTWQNRLQYETDDRKRDYDYYIMHTARIVFPIVSLLNFRRPLSTIGCWIRET